MFQPPAPGREGAAEPAAPGKPAAPPAKAGGEGQATGTTPPQQPEGGPPPGTDGGGGMSTLIMLAPIIFLVGVMFLLNRNEKKKRTDLEAKLKKGDRVVTRSGITGKLLEITDTNARVEIAPGVNVTMVKTAIEGLYQPDDQKSSAGDKGDKSADDKKSAKDSKKKK